MKLTQIKGNTWCLDGLELIPVYRVDEHRCILLDSGWRFERKDLEETLEREGLIPVGVISSHTHEDHVGNHAWLKEKYGTKKVFIYYIGAVIGSHAGPGTMAVFFLGNHR